MSAPYATVILPTLNRASTLPLALASVQAQSVQSLEIFVVLDGATAACRDAAASMARTDARIRIFDLPKARGHAADNIDRAIMRASTERIFYIDDDDLWLSDHVAQLGPLLECADVADSRVCSVDRNGRTHLGASRGCNPRVRELLGAGRLKMLYDTHIAHRKDAYGRIARWGSGTQDDVEAFLAALAKDPACRWASCDAVTALSFHGATRRDMPAELRGAELAFWAGLLARRQAILAGADALFHLFRLCIFDPPAGTAESYFASRGCYADLASGAQHRALFDLCGKRPPPDSVAVELAFRLSEAVESGYLFENVALACFEAYGQVEHERILREVAMREGVNKAARLAAYSAALVRRDRALALATARTALALGPDPIGALARWCDRLAA
jgi:glycosyltransferase involved in cell wall biosynthesis